MQPCMVYPRMSRIFVLYQFSKSNALNLGETRILFSIISGKGEVGGRCGERIKVKLNPQAKACGYQLLFF